MPHRILVVDPHRSSLDGLKPWIDSTPDVGIWGHVSTWSDALEVLEAAQPDLILAHATSTRHEHADGMGLLRSEHPSIPILVAAPECGGADTGPALRAGARGVVPRSAPPEALLAAIRSVLMGHVILPESARDRFFSGTPRPPTEGSVDALSVRQLEVLRLIGHGLSTTEIARRLEISPKTVETHRVHIKSRLGLATANALIRWAALWVESGAGATDKRPANRS